MGWRPPVMICSIIFRIQRGVRRSRFKEAQQMGRKGKSLLLLFTTSKLWPTLLLAYSLLVPFWRLILTCLVFAQCRLTYASMHVPGTTLTAGATTVYLSRRMGAALMVLQTSAHMGPTVPTVEHGQPAPSSSLTPAVCNSTFLGQSVFKAWIARA